MTFRVHGLPAGQGNHRQSRSGAIYETTKNHKPWRMAVSYAALEARGPQKICFACPLEIGITFYLLRPKSAPKAITRPAKKPDIDKLIRSTLDALKGSGLILDDSLVVNLSASKEFASEDGPGASITVTERPR